MNGTTEVVAMTAASLVLYLLAALVMKWRQDHPPAPVPPPRHRRPRP